MDRTRDEGRGTRDEGRGTRDEGRGTRDEDISILLELMINISDCTILVFSCYKETRALSPDTGPT